MSESMAQVAVESTAANPTALKSTGVQAPVPPAVRRPIRRGSARLAAIVAPLAVAVVAGCASFGKPVNQEVALRVTEGGERAEANCVVSNDLGTWSVVAPVVLGVTRSEKPLEVECSTPEGLKAVRVFNSVRFGELPGGQSAYAYPDELELALARPDRLQTTGVSAPEFSMRNVTTFPVHSFATNRNRPEGASAKPRGTNPPDGSYSMTSSRQVSGSLFIAINTLSFRSPGGSAK